MPGNKSTEKKRQRQKMESRHRAKAVSDIGMS